MGSAKTTPTPPRLAPVYLVFGPEAFLRREAVARLVSAALEGQEDSMGRSTFEGDRASLADVLDEARMPSLLGDRRVVVVEGADDFISEHRARLEKYAGAPSDCGYLILVCQSEASNTKLFKAIKALDGVIKCEAMKGAALTAWISERGTSVYAKRLNPSAASGLRDLVGDSLGLLDQELDKLSTYVGARPEITLDDVEALVANNRERNVFAITDAMADGDAAAALRQWERVLATDRAAPGRAIGGLAWGIRRLIGAQDAIEGGAPVEAFSRQFYTDPGKLRARLKRLTKARLEDQLCDLLDADVGSKSGLAGVGRAVERFIVKHTLAAKGVAAGG